MRYDTRGHGRSGGASGPYTLERLGRGALAVLARAGVAHAHVCGLSLGGQTAMWLARHAGDRVGHVVLANTAARIGNPEGWAQRIHDVEARGLAPIAAAGPPRWFSEGFRVRHPQDVEAIRAMVAACPPEGYVGACAVLRDTDLTGELARIASPTLVIVGTYDLATTAAEGRGLADSIPGARLVELPAGHLSNVEEPEAFTTAVLDFLAD